MKYYILTLLSSLLLAVGIAGCKSGGASEGAASAPAHHEHGEGHHEHTTTATTAAVSAPSVFDAAPAVGAKATCPVSGEVFTVEADTDRAEHDGKHYVFCCSNCVDKFKADPSKFAGK